MLGLTTLLVIGVTHIALVRGTVSKAICGVDRRSLLGRPPNRQDLRGLLDRRVVSTS